jgi:multidrug resistance protein, MATE family
MIVIIGANLVNVILNYILIYGHWGFEPMGVEGAAWATFFSRTFMAIAIIFYIYIHPFFRKYREIFRLSGYAAPMFSRILNLGIPSGVQFIFEVAAFDFSLVMMGWFGTQTQAAHQIAINLATVSYMTTAGLAAAATVRVGYFAGLRDTRNMKASFHMLLVMAMGMMFLFAGLFVACRNWLPSLYVDDPAVIGIASSLLIVAALFQLADGAQVVCASALRGLQDVKVPSVLILIAYWVIALPLGYFLSSLDNIGPLGIWWGLCIGLTVTAAALFLRTRVLMNRTMIREHAAHS